VAGVASVQGNSKQRIFFIALSILGVMLILFFGLRALRAFKKFDGHRPPPMAEELQSDVNDIEDWMTIPFISHNYGMPPEILFDALNINGKENHKKSLKQLNDEFYSEQDGYVIETVRATILAHQPPLTPILPDTPVPPQNP
jgi:hypothetical protein